jgi:hypothetical protein
MNIYFDKQSTCGCRGAVELLQRYPWWVIIPTVMQSSNEAQAHAKLPGIFKPGLLPWCQPAPAPLTHVMPAQELAPGKHYAPLFQRPRSLPGGL